MKYTKTVVFFLIICIMCSTVVFGQEEEPIFLGKEIARHKDYSEETAREIDSAVRKIMDECFADARRILTEHRGDLEKLTDALVEHETLSDAEVRDLLGMAARETDAASDRPADPPPTDENRPQDDTEER